jgi:protein-arginine kinase activator protein McsA
MKSKVARLQKELEAAVAREDFENAAALRDQIRKCREESAQNSEEKK